ncbi:MAG: histidinol dehydrogenase [Cyclobacteriaceae bacterium]
MKKIIYPDQKNWEELCKRPAFDSTKLEANVRDILSTVKEQGDLALIDFNKKFDGVETERIKLDISEMTFNIDTDLADAIKIARDNIAKFHSARQEDSVKIETARGVRCWRKSVPIQNVGLYIPGGSAPLFSTLLMLVIPAQLAGCENIVVCTPPQKDQQLDPVIGWTCQLLGITKVFLTGGAQAIGAMAFGTDSIPKVYKIFGPGNQYVTAAKQLVQKDGVAIDMPAGPSEVLVIADESASPEFVAADLLSQAEHGADSQVVLVSNSKTLIKDVEMELVQQIKELPRKDIALKALENSQSILVRNLDEAIDFSNTYAPEHLIVATEDCDELGEKIVNAGSVFLGRWSCESAGDYASGTNHTLPTSGYARSYSGVSLDSFIKKITFQKISEEGIRELGPSIEKMAEAEKLQGHKNAVAVRLEKLKNKIKKE